VHARESKSCLFPYRITTIPVPLQLFIKLSWKPWKVPKNWEVYMPETSRMKRASVHIKNMRIKQCCNHRVWDFAMAFQPSARTSQTFEKRVPGPSCSKAGWRYPPFGQPWTEVTGCCFKSSNSSQLFRSTFVVLIKIIGTLTYRDTQIWMIATTIRFQNFITSFNI